MTRSQAVTLLMNRLGNRTGLEASIIAELQLKQTLLEHSPRLPWFLKKFSSGLVTVASTQTVAVPNDFLRESGEDSEGSLWIVNSDGTQSLLEKRNYDECAFDENLTGTGKPEYYNLVGSNFLLWKVPDAVYNLKLIYFGAAAALSTDIENAWLANAPEVLINLTGLEIAKNIRDQAMVARFDADRKEALIAMWHEDTARAEAGRSSVMGG